MSISVSEIRKWKKDGNWFINPSTGNRVKLGNDVTLGDRVKLGDRVTLGDRVKLGNDVTSESLNAAIKAIYCLEPYHIFTKWVTLERLSPNFDGGTPIRYDRGNVIEEPDAIICDQQCAIGLHVLKRGHRPEWAGLCGANHALIPLDVKVASEDICFAGLPTMDMKLRVKKLEVLT